MTTHPQKKWLGKVDKLMMVVLLLPVGYYYHCDTWCSIPFFEENKNLKVIFALLSYFFGVE